MRLFWLAIVALGTSHFASAATLGALSGSARLGSPLDVSVPVQWGADESPDALCIRPEVSFGDVPLGAGAVSARLLPTDARSGQIRIQTQQPVNEPFVAVALRVGCASPFQRRFMVLADISPDAPAQTEQSARSTSSVVLAAPSAVAPSSPAGRPVPLGEPTARPVARKADPSPALALDVELGAASKPRPRSVVRRPDDKPASGAPKLTLLPADLRDVPDLDPALRLTFSLGTEPTGNEDQRKAAAAAWRVLGASVDDQVAMALQLDTLQAQSAQWTKGQQDQTAALEALSARNAELEAQRFTNPLVLGLAALALAGLLAALLMWRRQAAAAKAGAEAPQWWSGSPVDDKAADADLGTGADLTTLKSPLTHPYGTDGKPLAVSKVTMPSSRAVSAASASDSPSDADNGSTQAPVESTPSQPVPLAAHERRDFLPSLMGVSRSVATEELLDVQQQADFFVSLGDNEQAIRILRTHISESVEPSPIFYLDLFKIFHKLNRQDDYAALREEFNQVFNAEAPPFAEFTVQGQGLEAFPVALAAITAQWPAPQVLDVIEQYLFRSPGQADVFDLDAYRELLMLYGVAKEIISVAASGEDRGLPDIADPLPPSRSAGVAAVTGAAPTMAMELDLAPMHSLEATRSSWHDPIPGLSDKQPAQPATSQAPATKGKGVDVDLDFL